MHYSVHGVIAAWFAVQIPVGERVKRLDNVNFSVFLVREWLSFLFQHQSCKRNKAAKFKLKCITSVGSKSFVTKKSQDCTILTD